MANILILSLVFPPDNVSTAHLMGDLAVDLKSRGHKITIVTTIPHYNTNFNANNKQGLINYWGTYLRSSEYYGIPVYHTIMPRKSGNYCMRILGWSGFHVLSLIAGMTIISKPDIIICPSPPLTIGLSAWLLCLYHRSRYIYNLQELYPDCIVNLGLLKNRYLIKMLHYMEAFVYRKANRITVISNDMKERLVEKGVPQKKIVLIPNFVDISSLIPLPKDNSFSREHNVHNKFVVCYAGNLGPAQELEKFIEAAQLLKDKDDIHFMLIGNGIVRESLIQCLKKLALPNFTILPQLSYSLVPLIYASSDLSLVPLRSDIASDALPSKVYRIMACERAILAATNLNSDLGRLVIDAKCGIVVQGGCAIKLKKVIMNSFNNRQTLRQMGFAGRKHVVENFSRQAITKRYHSLVEIVQPGIQS